MSVLRRPAVLAVWAVLLALAAGFAITRHDDSKVKTTAKSSTTTTTAVVGAGTGPAGSGAGGTTAPGSSSSGAGGGSNTLPGDPGATVPDTGGSAPAERTMPLPGTYTMTTTGTSNTGTVPPQTKLVIEQLSDNEQKITSPTGSGDFVAQVRYLPTEADLESITVGPKSFQPNPPALFAPRPLAPGAQWSWSATSTDGKTNIAAQSRTTGTETITVGGQAVDTVIIDTTLTLSGDVTGTVQLTLWARPSDMLPIRQHAVANVSFGVLVSFQSDTTSQLVDLTPT